MSTQRNSKTQQQVGLTPQQKQQFHDDGFLFVRNLLPNEALQPLIDELAQRASCSGVKSGYSLTNLIKSLMRKKCLHLFWKSVLLVVSCGAGKDSFSIPLLSPPTSRVWKQNTSCEPYKRRSFPLV